MRCSVQNCTNDTKKTTKSHGITFHMFPKDPNLRSAWVEALGMLDWEPKDRSTICSEHFRNDDFYETKGGLRKIKDGAVPVVTHDSSEDLDAPAALRVCRICLAMEGQMYHIREHKLNEVYENVTGIYLSDDDKLPQKLCWECAHRLLKSNSFRSKALRSQALLMNLLQPERYITIRDVKSINRLHNQIKSSLITKIFEVNDSDLHIRDNVVIMPVKPENDVSDNDATDYNDDDNVPILQVEVKDECTNEIYFDEYNDDDSDDKKLSEVYVKPKKVKKKKLKVDKKPKVVKKCEDDNPTSTMDRYKTTDVKRRKTQDRLDESLFTITSLSYEEQIAEIHKRQEMSSYRNAPYKCTVCYRGFQIKDRYDAHIIRHSEVLPDSE